MESVSPPLGPDLPTVSERRAAGHALRQDRPRAAQAGWTPAADRRDPVAVVQDADRGRIAALLPLRYGRMQADAFAFLRGAAAVMAADLGRLPNSGLLVQACGDAHLANFGAFASPEGTPVFDITDFDETLAAPFEWDLQRLGASLAVAARTHGAPDKAARALARRAAHAYRRHIQHLSQVAPLEAWGSRIDLKAALGGVGDRAVRRSERERLHEAVAAGRDCYRNLVHQGSLRLPDRPGVHRLGLEEPTAHAAFAAYVAALAPERRVLLERYRLRDVAFKAVGVGSVGTFCAIGLFATADGDILLLQLKEAGRSVLAPFTPPTTYRSEGERVVTGQRMMQATTDVFLSWADDGPGGRHFYVRQLKDPRLASIGERIAASALPFYARLCGHTLARAHARTGDAARIAGYLGDGDAFDAALAEFALAYAVQTERDHAAFVAAISAGRIVAAAPRARGHGR